MADETAAPAPLAPPPDAALEMLAAIAGVAAAGREGGELVLHTDRAAAYAVLKQLRDGANFAFQQMMDVCAVDWPERAARFDIVYNLLSVTRNERIRVVVPVDESSLVASVSTLWPCATWWEREIWDLFGIGFDGLADQRRILTDYGFEGHPLRKDFPVTGYVEVHYDAERKAVVYDKVKLTQEFRNFDFLSPWEGMTSLPGDEKARPKP